MTEIEILKRAKMYMDKLANGINPIDDTEVSEYDVVNNIRISRCFFYISGVLEKVIENGGTVAAKKKTGSKAFAVTEEQLKNYEFSDRPIALSEIAKRIYSLAADEDMKKLTYNHLADWLMSVNMLEYAIGSDGATTKRPTDAGKRMGISVEKRQGQRGEYTAVVYDRRAQEFILDNMTAVIENMKKK